MTTNPKMNGISYANGATDGLQQPLISMNGGQAWSMQTMVSVGPRKLRLDPLAARAIRYELRGGHPDRQDDRRQELEEASRAACAEWRAMRWPGGMPEGDEEWVREGWES